ncbi:phospholipase A and acyltransferase 3-like isoform X2 [Mercenaria mercenaria]|uniref:phospholipase A and acyltransferase 3-like isoform X2 n=1 Tax=Mercenaria mercenaria TaxID=6596 RepID=UPI00234F0AB2|nr:phospholipase A and acyltransferase 3-like isoform X2 [Mercenaria mercenaria]
MASKQSFVLVEDLNEGDLIEFDRAMGTYSHWAVYVGNGDIIHYSPNPDAEGKFNFQSGTNKGLSVRKDKLREVAGNSDTYRNNEFDDELRKDEIVKRAHQRLGKSGYSIATSNCEHFATECRYGVTKSKQVKTVGQRALDCVIPSPVRAWNRSDVTEFLAPPVKWVADKMFSTHPGDLVRFQ